MEVPAWSVIAILTLGKAFLSQLIKANICEYQETLLGIVRVLTLAQASMYSEQM